ncbi:unnamed protein product, partial [Ectocarpus sp. 12 AP-2014]
SLDGIRIERVPRFQYLGAWIEENANANLEIRSRIAQAKTTFSKMKVLGNQKVSATLRIRLLKCYVWPVLLYASESWTIKKDMQKRVQSFETWCYRRIHKISWTQRMSNEQLFKDFKLKRTLLDSLAKRKSAYLGHVLRNENFALVKLILEGKITGKKKRGRPCMAWLDNVKQW